MKIGVSSYSFQRELKRGMDYFAACEEAARMGYEGIEFIDLELQYGRGEQAVEELADHLRAHCEGLGLAIPAYTVAADFLNGRGGTAAEEPERVKGCVDIAAHLGAPVMRHDAFWKLGALRDWRAAVEREPRHRHAGQRPRGDADPPGGPCQLRLAGGRGQFPLRG